MIPRRLSRAQVVVVAAALAAAAGPAAAAATGPAKGAKYRGTTTPGSEAVSFQVSRDGKRIVNFATRLGYNGKCGQGGGPTYAVKAASIRLRGGGSFSGQGTGSSGRQIAISGRITGRKASGVVEEPMALHCIFGPNRGANAYSETFTASAK